MKKNLLLIIAIPLLAFILYKNYLLYFSSKQKLLTTELSQSDPSKPTSEKQLNTPSDWFKKVETEYRLKPDQRFIHALQEIASFYPELQPIRVNANFTKDFWEITIQANGLAEFSYQIPELSDFDNYMKMLHDWSAYVVKHQPNRSANSDDNKKKPKISTIQFNTFDPTTLIELLNQLNKQWYEQPFSPAVFEMGAKAFSRLVFISRDKTEIADRLGGKALSILAMAQTLTKKPMFQEQSLLASRLGYSKQAFDLAAQLEKKTPWRLFIEKNNEVLGEIAAIPESTPEARYLWLYRIAEQNNYVLWSQYLKKHFVKNSIDIYALVTGTRISSFKPGTSINHAIPHLILGELLKKSNLNSTANKKNKAVDNPILNLSDSVKKIYDLLGSSPFKLIKQMENKLDVVGEQYQGPFIQQQDFQLFYRAYFYSSFYSLGLHYLDRYSSIDAVEKFSKSMGNPNQPLAQDFQHWFRALYDAKQGNINPSHLNEDISRLDRYGLPMVYRSFEAIKSTMSFGSPQIVNWVSNVHKYMDSRPNHRSKMAEIARIDLLNLAYAERLYKSIAEQNPHQSFLLLSWLGVYYNQPDAILDVANNSSVPVYSRARALQKLTDVDIPWSTLKNHFLELIDSNPKKWSVRELFIEKLDQHQEYQFALDTAEDWLKQNPASINGFDYLNAKIQLSIMQQKLGNISAAWNSIEPLIDSYYGNAMAQAFKVAMLNQDFERALDIAQKLHNRYPDSLSSLLPLIKYNWAQGDYSKAAKLLKNWTYPISSENWQLVLGTSFNSIFSAKPELAKEAWNALINVGFGAFDLEQIAAEVSLQGNPQLAFDLQSILKYQGLGQIDLWLRAYGYLELSQGHQVAIDWLKQKIPEQKRNISSMLFLGEKRYKLLWELIPHPEQGQYADAVWLYRAAAYIDDANKIDKQQKKQLLQYFNTADNSQYHLLGKMLLGIIEEKEVISKTMDSKQVCEAAFFLGIKAQSNDDYASAAKWFRASISTNLSKNGEYRWSYDRLYSWRNISRSLKIISKQKFGDT